jgi:hypothetical protein
LTSISITVSQPLSLGLSWATSVQPIPSPAVFLSHFHVIRLSVTWYQKWFLFLKFSNLNVIWFSHILPLTKLRRDRVEILNSWGARVAVGPAERRCPTGQQPWRIQYLLDLDLTWQLLAAGCDPRLPTLLRDAMRLQTKKCTDT